MAATTAALQAQFGRAGLGLSAFFVVLLGAATSGGMVGSAFLPDGFRELSAVLPAGVGLYAARSALYFGGAALAVPLVVLVVWIVVAIGVLVWAEARRATVNRPVAAPA